MVFYNYILYHCHFSCHILLSFLHFYNLPDQAVWAILVFILVVIPEILSLFIHFYLDIFIPVMCLDKAFNIELKAVSFYCFFFFFLSVWNSAGHLTNYEFFTKRKCKDDSNRLIYSLKMLCTYIADETESYINHFFISFQLVVKIILLAKCFWGVIISMAPSSLIYWYWRVFQLSLNLRPATLLCLPSIGFWFSHQTSLLLPFHSLEI